MWQLWRSASPHSSLSLGARNWELTLLRPAAAIRYRIPGCVPFPHPPRPIRPSSSIPLQAGPCTKATLCHQNPPRVAPEGRVDRQARDKHDASKGSPCATPLRSAVSCCLQRLGRVVFSSNGTCPPLGSTTTNTNVGRRLPEGTILQRRR